MALLGDRLELQTDISYYMPVASERGCIVIFSGAALGGSGAAMDQSTAVVNRPIAANVSGSKVAGLLLNDVVDIDATRQHLNQHKDEVLIGGKVRLLRQGWVVTNVISGTPTIGQDAYCDTTGGIAGGTAPTGFTKVGQFLSTKNEDGYAKVNINII